jgi:hypothetical protein
VESTVEAVRSYYASFGEREWTRLTTPIGAIEFAINSYALAKHLPPDARVLDIGGGPGRYALWLSAKGVNFLQAPQRQIWGDMLAIFADPDGNAFLLVDRL